MTNISFFFSKKIFCFVHNFFETKYFSFDFFLRERSRSVDAENGQTLDLTPSEPGDTGTGLQENHQSRPKSVSTRKWGSHDCRCYTTCHLFAKTNSFRYGELRLNTPQHFTKNLVSTIIAATVLPGNNISGILMVSKILISFFYTLNKLLSFAAF